MALQTSQALSPPQSNQKRDRSEPERHEQELRAMHSHETGERGRKRTRLTRENLNEHDRTISCERSCFRQDIRSASPNVEMKAIAHTWLDGCRSGSVASSLPSRRGRHAHLVSTADPVFPEQLRENGIFTFPLTSKGISDATILADRLNKAQDSPSPTRSEFDMYIKNYRITRGKPAVSFGLWSSFGKNANYPYVTDQMPWSAFRDDADGHVCEGISAPNPDLADYRTTWDDVYFRAATNCGLEGLLQPCGIGIPYAMPHFFVEFTDPLASIKTAEHRAAYAGACIVRSDACAHALVDRKLSSSQIRAISARFNGSEMQIDGHYMDLGAAGDAPKYFLHRLAVFSVTKSLDEFQSAVRAVRNAQDFGREKTEEILELLVYATSSPMTKRPWELSAPASNTSSSSIGCSLVGPELRLKPHDLDEVIAQLGVKRKSLLPSESKYQRHVDLIGSLLDKSAVQSDLWLDICPDLGWDYAPACVAWEAFSKCGTATVAHGQPIPKPDSAHYRSSMDGMYPHGSDVDLGGILFPTADRDVAMPHFTVAFTGSSESVDSALDRIGLEGACIMQSDMILHDYMARSFRTGRVRAFSVRYNGIDLKIDGHFAVGTFDCPEHHMYELASFKPTESPEQFHAALTAVHNASDLGQQKTEEIIQLLVEFL